MKTTFTTIQARNLIFYMIYGRIVQLSHLIKISNKKNPSFFDESSNLYVFDLIQNSVLKSAEYKLSESDTLFREAFVMFLRDKKKKKWYKKHYKEVIRQQAIKDIVAVNGIANEKSIMVTRDSRIIQ